MKEYNVENLLEVEGINALGYGIAAQAVMFDRSISIQSKAIYAYLVSYTGAGRTIFPKVETITSHLKMSKSTFYKHFKPLVENGYINVSKAKGFKNKNVYVICNNPQKINCVIENNKSESLLMLDGINAKGYGFIPKLAMVDERLSVKAKALIAFFYSLAQSGSRAFPHRSTIYVFLGISKDTYYKALNQLIEYNYIKIKQRKTTDGRFSVNDYILSSVTEAPRPKNKTVSKSPINTDYTPCPKNETVSEVTINTDSSPRPKNQNVKNSRVLKTDTLPCPKNWDNNNSTSNNSSNNISSSNLEVTSIAYTQNENEIRKMIYSLTRITDYTNNTDSFARKYCRTVKTLIGMLCVKDHALYSKQTVNTTTLFDYLNDCIVDDIDGNSLRDLISQTVWHFDFCLERYKINRPSEYLKALLWDEIKNFDL